MQTNKFKLNGVEVRYACPQCNGVKLVVTERGHCETCPTCQGEGHVWKRTEYGSKLQK